MQTQLADLAAYLGGAHVVGTNTLSQGVVTKVMQEARSMLGYIKTYVDLGPPRLEHLLHVPAVHGYCCFKLGRRCQPQTIFKALDASLKVASYYLNLHGALGGGNMVVVEEVHKAIQLLIKVRMAFKTRRMATLSVSVFNDLMARRRVLPIKYVCGVGGRAWVWLWRRRRWWWLS